jgi:hypothetical protein
MHLLKRFEQGELGLNRIEGPVYFRTRRTMSLRLSNDNALT